MPNSWVSAGQNRTIEPTDLDQVLTQQQIDFLTTRTGLLKEELLAGLSQQLPGRYRQAHPGRTSADRRRNFADGVGMGILWIIVIGFVAGIVARLLSPGPNRPAGFLLTTALGIAGAFLATFIGQAVGWYRLDQGAGFIGAIVGAVLVLFIWNRVAASRAR